MKNFLVYLFSFALLFPLINVNAQNENEEEVVIKLSLNKSGENVSVTIDTTFSSKDINSINIDSIVESVMSEMAKFDVYFDLDIDSTINSSMIWIDDSIDTHKIHKCIDIEKFKGIDKLDKERIDSMMSSNMIIIKSTLDSLTNESIIDMEIFADSLTKCNDIHVIKMMIDKDLDFDFDYRVDTVGGEFEKHIFYLQGDENMILDGMDENVHVIKKMIKKSSDGKGDVMEVTYEIGIEDEMELNEIDKDGNIIKRIIKGSGDKEGEFIYEIFIDDETVIEEIDEDGNKVKKIIRKSGDGEEGIEKIMIIDDGSASLKHNMFVHKSEMLEFEVFDLTKQEKSVYGDKIDIKGKEKLKLNNLAIFPNPNSGKFRLSFDIENDETVTVKIFDMDGKTLFESETMNNKGKYFAKINLKSIQSGNYILKIQQGKKFKTKRLYIK